MEEERMKRQIISSALALSMIFGGAAALPESFVPQSSIVAQAKSLVSGDFKYSVLKNGTVKIVKYNGSKTEVKIPSKIDGKKVTMIGKWAFCLDKKIKKITIPKGVTKIGDSAFKDCTALKTIKLPASLKTIGYEAFYGCTSLRTVTIPKGVKTIGAGAFLECKNLKTIKIPGTVKTFEIGAFAGTKWLKEQQKKDPLVVVNGILIDGSKCKGNVTLPKSVKRIGEYAFGKIMYSDTGIFTEGNKKIKSVKLQKSVKSIGKGAFTYCTELKTVTIPKSVKTIDDTFFCCSKLTIKTPKGSAAAKFAKKNGIKVKYI